LAPLPDGGFAAFWGHSFGVRGQRFDKNFNPVGGDFPFADIGEAWPDMTALANGDIVVAGDHISPPYPVIAKRYNSSLAPYGPETQANVTSPGIRLFTSAIAGAPNGNYTVAWYNASGDIIARSFNPSGNPLGGEFKVNSSTGGTRVQPGLVYNSRNELVVAWHGKSDGDPDGIYARRFRPDNTPIGAEWQVNQTPAGSQYLANIAIGGNDEIVISWTSTNANESDVFARLYGADLTPIGAEFRVNQFTSGGQRTPVFGGRRGNAIIGNQLVFTWTGSGQQGVGVYMTIFSVSDIAPVATVSAASFRQPPIARESIATSFGANLATAVQAASSIPLPTTLAGTMVEVSDSTGAKRLAPLFFVSPTQINYQMPPGTANGAANIAITSGNGTVSNGAAQIESVAPGLFSANADGQGVAAAVALRVRGNQQTFEPVAQLNPAQGKFFAVPIDLGPETDQVFLIAFGTGIRFRSSLSAVTASIGGANAEVLFAGAQGGLVGLDQINLRISRNLAGRGDVDVALTADGKTANTMKVNIK
ncbi:MAG: hypothetical protein ACREEM_17845, partial [Blastocatellia bacterium]